MESAEVIFAEGSRTDDAYFLGVHLSFGDLTGLGGDGGHGIAGVHDAGCPGSEFREIDPGVIGGNEHEIGGADTGLIPLDGFHAGVFAWGRRRECGDRSS